MHSDSMACQFCGEADGDCLGHATCEPAPFADVLASVTPTAVGPFAGLVRFGIQPVALRRAAVASILYRVMSRVDGTPTHAPLNEHARAVFRSRFAYVRPSLGIWTASLH